MPSLAKQGKRMLDKTQFEQIWQAGEGATEVPLLNFDLHVAKVRNRYRDLTVADVANNVDLTSLKVDFTEVLIPTDEILKSADTKAFINSFLDCLDKANTSDQENILTTNFDLPLTNEPNFFITKTNQQQEVNQDKEYDAELS